ncbi:MAG: SDR family oxidoreductase [Thermoleophilia bacterium]|nr:SDR family oxidoreductase [Thermoleophilia bacterium]
METLPEQEMIGDDDRPVVLVTGASSGIGREVAIRMVRTLDARLVLAARRGEQLEETASVAGARDAVLVPCDLSTAAGVDELVARVRQLGRLDVLVNNAGSASDHPFEHPDAMVDADRMLALNLRTPIALVHALTPLLEQRRGTIVNVSSVAGLVGTPGSDVYCATKFALTGFSEASRARLQRRGVRVVCVQPGPVPTPGWPHERLRSTPVLGRVFASDVQTIADACVRAARGKGSAAPVRPRIYAGIPLLRALAPWLLRRLLVRAAGHRRYADGSNAARTGDQPT